MTNNSQSRSNGNYKASWNFGRPNVNGRSQWRQSYQSQNEPASSATTSRNTTAMFGAMESAKLISSEYDDSGDGGNMQNQADNFDVRKNECMERNVKMTSSFLNESEICVSDVSTNKIEVMKNEIIARKPEKNIELCGKQINALIDSGSDMNLIRDDFCSTICVEKYDENITMRGLGDSCVRSLGLIKIDFCVDDRKYYQVTFHIVPKECMPYKLIIGQEFLKTVVMVMKEGSVWLFPKDEEWLTNVNCFPCTVDLLGTVSDPVLKQEVIKLVENYQPKQTKEVPVELKIILKDDIPVAQRPRRVSVKEQEEVDKQIEQWLKDGIIKRTKKRRFSV
ncbi:uncharacterized protein LOC126381637 isoform X2 [Pectinophora gossypiella]|uniref:uncharacterized protein LOC126381637 isoform X2 n=1 Tax=Pectinophora gossypiella TaxID=13191 RepID=UPI00214ED4B3|nr:uncharacterized protein LOC126381637 isoform X2 [Pectinophora gossypiella]